MKWLVHLISLPEIFLSMSNQEETPKQTQNSREGLYIPSVWRDVLRSPWDCYARFCDLRDPRDNIFPVINVLPSLNNVIAGRGIWFIYINWGRMQNIFLYIVEGKFDNIR